MLRHDDTTPHREWVRALRARLGLTQVEFARLIEVHAITVARWETGTRHLRGTYRARLNAIAGAMGMRPIAPHRRRGGRIVGPARERVSDGPE